jgi:cytochrome c oxidase assembly protein subunit 15
MYQKQAHLKHRGFKTQHFHFTYTVRFIIVLLTNVFTILNKKLVIGYKLKWVLYILVIEIISGISMYFDFLLNSNHSYRSRYILFGIQFYLIFRLELKIFVTDSN